MLHPRYIAGRHNRYICSVCYKNYQAEEIINKKLCDCCGTPISGGIETVCSGVFECSCFQSCEHAKKHDGSGCRPFYCLTVNRMVQCINTSEENMMYKRDQIPKGTEIEQSVTYTRTFKVKCVG